MSQVSKFYFFDGYRFGKTTAARLVQALVVPSNPPLALKRTTKKKPQTLRTEAHRLDEDARPSASRCRLPKITGKWLIGPRKSLLSALPQACQAHYSRSHWSTWRSPMD